MKTRKLEQEPTETKMGIFDRMDRICRMEATGEHRLAQMKTLRRQKGRSAFSLICANLWQALASFATFALLGGYSCCFAVKNSVSKSVKPVKAVKSFGPCFLAAILFPATVCNWLGQKPITDFT